MNFINSISNVLIQQPHKKLGKLHTAMAKKLREMDSFDNEPYEIARLLNELFAYRLITGDDQFHAIPHRIVPPDFRSWYTPVTKIKINLSNWIQSNSIADVHMYQLFHSVTALHTLYNECLNSSEELRNKLQVNSIEIEKAHLQLTALQYKLNSYHENCRLFKESLTFLSDQDFGVNNEIAKNILDECNKWFITAKRSNNLHKSINRKIS